MGEPEQEKAIGYGRCSTPPQVLTGSLERQAKALAEYVARKNYVLIDSYNESISGWKGASRKKGALFTIIALLKAGKIKPGVILLVEAIDRLTREHAFDALELIQELIKLGMPVETIEDGQRYDRDCFQRGTIHILLAKLAQANGETQRKSDLVRAGKLLAKQEIAEGKRTPGKSCPTWLKYDPFVRTYTPKPGAEDTLILIFEASAGGAGLLEIVKLLIAKERPPFHGKGIGWQPSTVYKILRNPAVMGEYHGRCRNPETKGRPERDDRVGVGRPYPPIIPPEEFGRVETALHDRRKGGGRKGIYIHSLLTGLPRCAVCRGSAAYRDKGVRRANAAKPRKSRAPRSGAALQCVAALHGICINRARIPYGPLETAILDTLLDFAIEPTMRPTRTEPSPEIAALDAQIQPLQARYVNLSAAFAGTVSETLTEQLREIMVKLDALKAQRRAAEREVILESGRAPLHEHIAVVREMRAQAEQMDDLPARRKARLAIQGALRSLVDEITCHTDRSATVTFTWGKGDERPEPPRAWRSGTMVRLSDQFRILGTYKMRVPADAGPPPEGEDHFGGGLGNVTYDVRIPHLLDSITPDGIPPEIDIVDPLVGVLPSPRFRRRPRLKHPAAQIG